MYPTGSCHKCIPSVIRSSVNLSWFHKGSPYIQSCRMSTGTWLSESKIPLSFVSNNLESFIIWNLMEDIKPLSFFQVPLKYSARPINREPLTQDYRNIAVLIYGARGSLTTSFSRPVVSGEVVFGRTDLDFLYPFISLVHWAQFWYNLGLGVPAVYLLNDL